MSMIMVSLTRTHSTAVGGTHLGLFESGKEKTWGDGGGGFSNVFPMPPYQRNAVAAYLAANKGSLPPQKYVRLRVRVCVCSVQLY